jgi:hypothetical protein
MDLNFRKLRRSRKTLKIARIYKLILNSVEASDFDGLFYKFIVYRNKKFNALV